MWHIMWIVARKGLRVNEGNSIKQFAIHPVGTMVLSSSLEEIDPYTVFKILTGAN